MRSLCNSHQGESCIIVCNGPSLNLISDSFLEKNTTFGMNRIFLREGFVPDYLVAVNPLVIEQSWHDLLHFPTTRFLSEKFLKRYTETTVNTKHEMHFLHSVSIPNFSYDPSRYVYEGYTVTFVCLQLAFFMGFTRVGLVGCDHRFRYDGVPNEERMMDGPDPNHFTSEYFAGQKWNNPDLARSEQAYQMAKVAFESVGRVIINLTEGSALDVFPKMALATWIP